MNSTREVILSSSIDKDQVAQILSDQYYNLRKDAQDLADYWIGSDVFYLDTIPIDSVAPVTLVEDAKSMSEGPIIVDININNVGRIQSEFGTHGVPPDVIILDGKHRWFAAKDRGDKTIDAYVGNLARGYIDKFESAQLSKDSEIQDAIDVFLNIDNPSPGSALMKLRVLLPEDQVEQLREQRRKLKKGSLMRKQAQGHDDFFHAPPRSEKYPDQYTVAITNLVPGEGYGEILYEEDYDNLEQAEEAYARWAKDINVLKEDLSIFDANTGKVIKEFAPEETISKWCTEDEDAWIIKKGPYYFVEYADGNIVDADSLQEAEQKLEGYGFYPVTVQRANRRRAQVDVDKAPIGTNVKVKNRNYTKVEEDLWSGPTGIPMYKNRSISDMLSRGAQALDFAGEQNELIRALQAWEPKLPNLKEWIQAVKQSSTWNHLKEIWDALWKTKEDTKGPEKTHEYREFVEFEDTGEEPLELAAKRQLKKALRILAQEDEKYVLVSDHYSQDSYIITEDQFYDMCDQMGWDRPHLTRGSDGLYENGELVLETFDSYESDGGDVSKLESVED